MWLRVLELAIALIFLLMIITQLIIPLWNDRKIFPIFRKRKIQKMKVDLNELKDVEKELDDMWQNMSELSNTVHHNKYHHSEHHNNHNDHHNSHDYHSSHHSSNDGSSTTDSSSAGE